MKRIYEPADLIEKDRIRIRISAQVDEFLRCGGRIKVLIDSDPKRGAGIGGAWKNQEELPELSEW